MLSDAFHSFQGSQREKKNRQLVFKLSHIDTPNCARSAHCLVSNTQSGKWPQRCVWPRLTQQSLPWWAPSPGQPPCAAAGCRRAGISSQLSKQARSEHSPWQVFTVWWQVSQSCWWSVTLEDRCTDLCLGFLSYPGGAGQVHNEVPLLIQPPKMKVAM